MASNTKDIGIDQVNLDERLRDAAMALQGSVEINIDKRGGVPMLKGTRVPISLVLAELADNANISEIADDFDLSEELLRGVLEGLALHFDRSFVK